jgi:hypothetical protein
MSSAIPSQSRKLVELLVVDAMGSFDFAVQVWCSRADVHMANVELLERPVEMRSELRAIVGLNDMHAEGQSRTSSMNAMAVR